MYDFKKHIETLRIIQPQKIDFAKYEKIYGKIKGGISQQKWYKDYVELFNDEINYELPENTTRDCDWKLLHKLIFSSFSSKSFIDINPENKEKKELYVVVTNKNGGAEKRVSELSEEQIDRLFEIYVEENFNLQLILGTEKNEAVEILTHRSEILRKNKGLETKYIESKVKHIYDSPDLIYHYTSIENAYNILKSRSVYASDLRYLNDKSEIIHGIQIAKEFIQNYKQNDNFSSKIEVLNYLLNRLIDNHFFAVCFSKNGNVLSQWRAYTSNGKGLSIGFNEEKLTKILNTRFDVVTYDISYKKERQIKLFEGIYLDWFKHHEKLDFNSTDLEESTFEQLDLKFHLTKLQNLLIQAVQIVKHDSFYEENEFRIIFKNDHVIKSNVSFRTNPNYLIPYVKVDFSDNYINPIEQIIIGPTSDLSLTKQALSAFLVSNGYEKVEIIESGIPYRI